MRIDVWSDVVCPWCYLGARRLDEAVERARIDDVDVHWRAYQLDPTAPPEPQDLATVLDRKYGPGAYESMTTRLVALGSEVGIDYRFDLAVRINTADAHRMIAWAGSLGADAQNSLVMRLFEGYFTNGENLAEHAALLSAASDVGLDVDAASSVLASDRGRDQVIADQRAAMDRDITGVPAFVIDDKWLIPGAQDIDQMVRLLERAQSKASSAQSDAGPRS